MSFCIPGPVFLNKIFKATGSSDKTKEAKQKMGQTQEKTHNQKIKWIPMEDGKEIMKNNKKRWI